MLHAGEHLLPWLNTPEVLLITLDGSEVPDVLADYLRRFQPDWVEKYCLVADLSEIEAGALYMDGILLEILPPSTRRLYWRVEDDLTLVADEYAASPGTNGGDECGIATTAQRGS